MADRTQAASIMTLERFIAAAEPDGAPGILLRTRAKTSTGGRRSVSLKVFVHDPELYRRLRASVSEGQELRVTTETDWDALAEGDRLIDFDPIGVGQAAAATSHRA